ncbi:alpha/beta hydrolase [Moraxella atlantae]|uniref:alpha/beta hydrolase n=1 Tax=Faucicola atlantae TaxID=34059 RepID=UPI00375062AB
MQPTNDQYAQLMRGMLACGVLVCTLADAQVFSALPTPARTIALWSPAQLQRDWGSDTPMPVEQVSNKGAVTQVGNPRMMLYVPTSGSQNRHTAIIVLSGGGYASEQLGKEGTPAAQWLAEQGFSVFNTIYRLPAEGWTHKTVAWADAQQAVRLARSLATTYGYQRVGVMGFSAGGHIAGMIATHPHIDYANTPNAKASASTTPSPTTRPDFAVLLYPIVSMLPPNNRSRSYKILLGDWQKKQQMGMITLSALHQAEAAYSVETAITSDTPPMFIAHAVDDRIAPVAKSQVLYSKLQQAGVASTLQLYASGGHGWGMGKPNTPTTGWRQAFLTWFDSLPKQ